MKRTLSLLLVLLLIVPFAFADAEVNANELDKLNEIIDTIERNYHSTVSHEALIEGAYRGIVETLDKHSDYLSAEDLAAFNDSISGSFVGVGISINEKGDYIEVIAPIADSPAEKVGIKAGDLIIAVDGKSIKGKPLKEVVDMIKGPIDTDVKLTIERQSTNKKIDFTITRARVVIKSVAHKVVEGVDVIKISSFDKNTASELKEILKNDGIGQKIIIDLRANPGGLLGQVVQIADLFLAKGKTICSVDYRNYDDSVFKSNKDGLTADLVVLVDNGSASASELFAAAIQDNQRGTIVGQTTYGKGTVQSVYDLADGSALKLTIAKYATPSGEFIDGIGVTPDVFVEDKPIISELVDNFYPMQSLNTSARGSRDIDTYGLEQRLDYMGYDVVIDGYFDQVTEAALKQYQTEHQLAPTGRLTVDMKIVIQADIIERDQKKNDSVLTEALKIIKNN